MGPLPPTQDDRLIWDMWQSQFTLPAMTVADELGVFGAIGDAPRSVADLAAMLKVDERALGLLLAALASLGLAEKRADTWIGTPASRTWLHPAAEGYWGGFIFRFRDTIPLHAQLIEAIRTGRRPTNTVAGGPEWERGTMTQDVAKRIADFMHAHSLAPAAAAAAQPDLAGIGSLMDVGCGSGVYGIAIARAHPQTQVTLLDLKEMVTQAGHFVDKAGLSERIALAGCNMFEDDWPTGHEAHFFANIFHDWSEETNALLAAKSFAALPSGGRIFLSEILVDDAMDGPWHAAAFSLMMLMGTLGKQYTLPEFTTILEAAGFVDVQAARTGGGYYSLVSARKP